MIRVSYSNDNAYEQFVIETNRRGFINHAYLPPNYTIIHLDAPGDVITIRKVEREVERSADTIPETEG